MHIANPERALWQAVLLQAIEEALHGPKSVSTLHRAREWQEARDYITTPSEDLEMVCSLAGVEMEAVVERMKLETKSRHRNANFHGLGTLRERNLVQRKDSS
ncbi:hypothetical protein [Rhodobacter sp. SY28-1]|uniref:hypothetical protein n=1 Tax=Rhodobacter sp. SY28-1 TaxID=2562317 RepID=UPI0010C09A6C|nr:hypothetical protein [Rhodobacter sp. SY28-1]